MRTRAWVTTLILAPALASADPRPIRVEVDYIAPAECPAKDAFIARIRQTNAQVEPASQAAPLGVKVRIARLPTEGYAAELFIRATDSDDTTRRLTGDTCDEAMVAAALVVAVLADTADAAAQTKAEPVPSAPPPAPAPSVAPDAPTREDTAGDPWHFGLGAHLALDSGLGPDLEPQSRPFLGVSRGRFGVRLAVHRNSVSVATNDGTAATTWWLARTEACYRVTSGDAIWLSPCLGFEAGSVSASGSRTSRPRDEARLVLGPLALGRVGFRLAEGLSFELDAGLRVPLARYRFVFGDDTTAYEMPGVAFTSGLGIGFVTR